MNKGVKKMLPIIIAAVTIIAAYVLGVGTVKSSILTIHEREYQGGFVGMSYKDLRTLSYHRLGENRTVYRNILHGISVKTCNISKESVTLKFSDRAFVNGEDVEEVTINKGEDIYISFAGSTTGIDLEVEYN